MNIPNRLTFALSILLLAVSCKKNKEEIPPNLHIETNFPIVIELPDILTENSGIILSEENYLWTHNDGGDAPNLYEISLEENTIRKTATLNNVNNKDWEALTTDGTVAFIGDFGNNNGSRTDLAIHKFSMFDLQSLDSLSVSTIFFSYEDQTDFSPSSNHNFDCEAMISLTDKLFLFTKNRGNLQTHIYQLSKSPGTQIAQLYDTLHVDGLMTDAAINMAGNTICLLGYNEDGATYHPFIWILYDFPGTDFLAGKRKRIELDMEKQTEAICFKDNGTVYFTSEEENGEKAFVYSFDVEKWME